MNLDPSLPQKKASAPVPVDLDLDEFEFKPITSGLGFSHQSKVTSEIKPAFVERSVPAREPVKARPQPAPRTEMNVYQNDLSLFYGQTDSQSLNTSKVPEPAPEKIYRTATKADRIISYVLDLSLITSVLSMMLVFMTRALEMEILEAWSLYPDEITPLIVTLFSGFYVLYFSISEKSGSTFGKSLLKIKVVSTDHRPQEFMTLVLRSVITLANFVSLGLFSYFDLQNRATSSKVIKAD